MKRHFIDKYSDLSSPVHRLDPRVKILLAFSGILIIVSEPPASLLPFAFYAGLLAALLLLSKLPLGFILTRYLMLSPFIFLAALFYPVSLYLSGETQAIFLQPGALKVAGSIFLKASFSLVLLLWLISTEKFHTLLLGFRKLRMPRLVGVISALMYRYIFVLWDETLKTTRARQSRTPGKLRNKKLNVYSNQLAMIFLRSWERSKVIHHSMLSRGFSGEFPGMKTLKLQKSDILFLSVFLLLFLLIRLFTGFIFTQ
ncbi:MAG: cobalt ECF transporter T component CbiQ [Bacteroidales bacterium]